MDDPTPKLAPWIMTAREFERMTPEERREWARTNKKPERLQRALVEEGRVVKGVGEEKRESP